MGFGGYLLSLRPVQCQSWAIPAKLMVSFNITLQGPVSTADTHSFTESTKCHQTQVGKANAGAGPGPPLFSGFRSGLVTTKMRRPSLSFLRIRFERIATNRANCSCVWYVVSRKLRCITSESSANDESIQSREVGGFQLNEVDASKQGTPRDSTLAHAHTVVHTCEGVNLLTTC